MLLLLLIMLYKVVLTLNVVKCHVIRWFFVVVVVVVVESDVLVMHHTFQVFLSLGSRRCCLRMKVKF